MVSGTIESQYQCDRSPSADRSAWAEQENLSAIVQGIGSRLRPDGHIIVFANEKGGVGKSTLAFHCSVALANAGRRVAAVDLDRRQETLNSALTSREGTGRYLEAELPCPKHVTVAEHSGVRLMQEIVRIGSGCDFIVIDAPGHDCPIARWAIAAADTLVTPVNCSLIDLAVLGKFDPVSLRLKEPGPFAHLVECLRRERAHHGLPGLNWIVMKNRRRRLERTQQARIDEALQALSNGLDFRLGEGLHERVAYRELFLFGLTQLDKKFLPFSTRNERTVEQEIGKLVASLSLPIKLSTAIPSKCKSRASVSKTSAQSFIETLFSQAGKRSRVCA